jgi:uncharacterized protein (DUF342 family)
MATVIPESEVSKYQGSYDIQPYLQLGQGPNVVFDEQKQEFKAACYGFAKVTDTRKIDVDPLVFPSKSKLAGYMFIYQTKRYEFPNLKDIKRSMEAAGIVYSLEDEKVNQQLVKIVDNPQYEGTRILVGKGVKPTDGQIEHVVLLKQKDSKVGTLRNDGSMDYKEKDFVTKVEAGEQICELKPYIPAQNGYTIYGEPVPGRMLGEKKYKIGTGLTPSKENGNIYVAATEGALQITTEFKISVENKVIIKKDVDLNTGNLNINGTIEIGGSIQPGFIVKATGSIIVNQSIEDATVEAGGDIIVNHGILGKDKDSCFVKATGSIKAKFMQNAKVNAGAKVIIKESAVQCDITSKDTVNIGTSVVGGRVVGKNGLEVGIAGSHSYTKTVLITGKDMEIEEKIDELNRKIKQTSKEYKEHLEDMKMNFGENFILDMASFVKGLIGPRKIKFVEMLKKLQDFNKLINSASHQREKLKEMIVFPKPPTISIKEKIYPEVFIQIRDAIKKIDKENDTTTYREDPELKIII